MNRILSGLISFSTPGDIFKLCGKGKKAEKRMAHTARIQRDSVCTGREAIP